MKLTMTESSIKMKSFLLLYALSFFSLLLHANPENLSQNNLAVVKSKIKDIKWLANQEIVINAVLEQNKQKLTLQEILSRDKLWQKTKELTAFKQSLQEGQCGFFIQGLVKNSKVFNEIFVTDNQGANLCAYPATSDYWQGDESKWQIPFKTGEIFIGPADFDESSQQRSVQISIPIKYNSMVIGVLVAGIKMSYVEYKALQQLVSIQDQSDDQFRLNKILK